jgi:adenylate cyclase
MQRRLAAIVAVDVVGYSSLMGADEEGTLTRLKAIRREVVDPNVEAHEGRVVKSSGDGLLLEFASAVAAVQCSMAIQTALGEQNRTEAPERRIVFRIGINVGDVIVEPDRDVYGDGVNIAARLETLAEPGSICISRTVRDQVRDKLPYGFEDLGEQTFKNIARQVRAFRVIDGSARPTAAPAARRKSAPLVANAPLPAAALALVLLFIAAGVAWLQPWTPVVDAASEDRMAFPLPDRPSLAVLPFATHAADPGQDYLGDGLSENIITGLSKVSGLFVVAGASTAPYKGSAVTAKAVAEELGVRYVLSGGLQRIDNRVRVTTQLVDAMSGEQVWAERFDRGLEDLLRLQDEITLQVVTEMRVRLTVGEQTLLVNSVTVPLEVVELSFRARDRFLRFSRTNNEEARRLAAKAAAISPNYAFPWLMLAWSHWMDVWRGWTDDPAEVKRQVLEAMQRVEELAGPDEVQLIYLQAAIALSDQRYADAVERGRKVTSLAPNFADGRAFLGLCLVTAGNYLEAIEELQQAMRLSPVYPEWYLRNLANAYRLTGRHHDAEAGLREVLRRNPSSGTARLDLAILLASLDRTEEAKLEIAQYLTLDPDHSLRQWLSTRFADTDLVQRELTLLKQLGLPE